MKKLFLYAVFMLGAQSLYGASSSYGPAERLREATHGVDPVSARRSLVEAQLGSYQAFDEKIKTAPATVFHEDRKLHENAKNFLKGVANDLRAVKAGKLQPTLLLKATEDMLPQLEEAGF